MTDAEQLGDGAAGWRARRRWLWTLVGVTVVVYGVGAVVWRLVTGHSWAETWSFAACLAAINVIGQWVAAVIRRRAGRGDG
ncbi:hypothetical protein [Streptomyces canus]|uniref:hypothetical protein n=1 Tax=Streptomyces canus TaxID=58343 RepID=UPI00324A8177